MRYKSWLFIGFLILLSLCYTWYEANKPREADWTESYSPLEKEPYGTYILCEGLPRLFPSCSLQFSRRPVTELLSALKDSVPSACIFINGQLSLNQSEQQCILDYVAAGNSLFLAASIFPDTLLSALRLGENFCELSDTTWLICPGQELSGYRLKKNNSYYFVPEEGFKGEILGMVSGEKPDFVRADYGKGQFYLNLNPRAFTNYLILDTLTGDYYSKALSYLPDDGRLVVFDQYTTLGPELDGREGMLRVILHYKALRLALYLLLACGLLYILFRVKREQRAIPVIRPYENRMLEFTATVSSLYFKRKDHQAIALKRIDLFMDELRTRYLLQGDETDERLVYTLTRRLECRPEEAVALIALIRQIRSGENVDGRVLKNLVKKMEKLKI